MDARGRYSPKMILVVGVLLIVTAKALAVGSRAAESPSRTDYSPVAAPASMLQAIRINLKLVEDWLADGDFDSAAETAVSVQILSELLQYCSNDPDWQKRSQTLLAHGKRLFDAAKSKEEAACSESLKACLESVKILETNPAVGEPAVVKQFRPPASHRAMMKLMDGTYSDAKAAKSVAQLIPLAQVLAEGANVVSHLRGESEWRARAMAVRDLALRTAALMPDADLKVARLELKNVYNRCHACHEAYRR